MPYRENGKKLIMHDGILENLLFQDHHLIKKTKSKINSNDLHKVQIIIKYKNLRPNLTLKRFLKTPT